MDYAIEARDISKYYGKRRPRLALDRISLSVGEGQLFGLIGPDGAGKTTMLRILSTVMELSSGQTRIAGFDTQKNAEQARSLIGYMPQAFSLYPDLSVIENLNFFADINGVPHGRREARIAQLLDFARLDRFQHRRSALLSGGMRKKLALACALVHDPKVLLLDEPTTGVDPLSRRELWGILAQVVLQGVTVLISTPYMDEAERCHQIAMLHQGEILSQGNPADLASDLPFDVIEVKARPRKAMRAIVDQADGVSDWRPVGDRLRLSVQNRNGNGNAKRILKNLQSQFKRQKMEVHILRPSKISMEDVFVYLVGQQRGKR
ncbi:MAG: ABC transporter ATP-binding protein [Chloroflexi bacterium]|jgi:ABC-2 type transport system ATP-binding protein|nr:ABC transporter ATP-binding protein [Chloroflexota bacterium]